MTHESPSSEEFPLGSTGSALPHGSTLPNLPLVSIVTPSYNQAQFIGETIRSVLTQDYPYIEYLIVDGGSTDGSVEIIKEFSDGLLRKEAQLHTDQEDISIDSTLPRRLWWVSEKDQGQTDAINKGFARARGEILAWINSDDTYLPHAISEAVTFLKSHPEAGMVYGDANLIDEKGQVLGRFPARQTNYARLRKGYVHIPQQAAFFRADLWRQVGPLDPTFYFAMDYDLWVRISRQSPIIYHPLLWANFRLHSSGKSVIADNRCWPEMLKVHFREGGNIFSPIYFKAKTRPLFYSWLPLQARLWIRKHL